MCGGAERYPDPVPKIENGRLVQWYPALKICAHSSVVERCPDKTEVLGSIPSVRTNQAQILLWGRERCLPRTEFRSGVGS